MVKTGMMYTVVYHVYGKDRNDVYSCVPCIYMVKTGMMYTVVYHVYLW